MVRKDELSGLEFIFLENTSGLALRLSSRLGSALLLSILACSTLWWSDCSLSKLFTFRAKDALSPNPLQLLEPNVAQLEMPAQ